MGVISREADILEDVIGQLHQRAALAGAFYAGFYKDECRAYGVEERTETTFALYCGVVIVARLLRCVMKTMHF